MLEYKIEATYEGWADFLERNAEEGWELVCTYGVHWIFKREKRVVNENFTDKAVDALYKLVGDNKDYFGIGKSRGVLLLYTNLYSLHEKKYGSILNVPVFWYYIGSPERWKSREAK